MLPYIKKSLKFNFLPYKVYIKPYIHGCTKKCLRRNGA